jgi:signal peptidase I
VTGSRLRAGLVVAGAVLLGAGFAVAAQSSGIHLTRVVSDSMSPAIDQGDWTITRDLGEHDRRAIRRRDIVLFRFPLGTASRAVKRVVAVAGDTVAISRRSVTVGDHVIPIAGAPSAGAAQRRRETVPEGHVFLLGDNAAVSIDSRSLGSVPTTEVVGRVLLVLPRRLLLQVLALAATVSLVLAGVLVARRNRRASA